jgi:hypothetical protein
MKIINLIGNSQSNAKNLLVELSRSLRGSISHSSVVVQPSIAIADIQAIQPVPPVSVRNSTKWILTTEQN